MKSLIFNVFGNCFLARSIAEILDITIGKFNMRSFPDKETYLRIREMVQNRNIIIMSSLNEPNQKILPLLFAANTIRDLGASQIGLIVPYLPYLRQDARFNFGEAVTSAYFSRLISNHFDWLLTVDPHLNRYKNLNEIYSIQTKVIQSGIEISRWIVQNIENPLLIGLGNKMEEWVRGIANGCNAPYVMFKKNRVSDRVVEISMPEINQYRGYNPILIDDIISTGQTMLEAIKRLKKTKMPPPICFAVHAVFAQGAYQQLQNAGVRQIVTCNTIYHPSNGIDLSFIISDGIQKQFIGEGRL